MTNNSDNYIDIEIINDKELLSLFQELQTNVQNKIVLDGMRKAAKVINQQARLNFASARKSKSRTGYKKMNSAFKIEPIKNPVNGFGVKVGVKYYKARWLEWGTNDREYETKNNVKHRTGKIQATHFFYRAVELRKAEAQQLVGKSVTDSMQRIIAKYENS